VNIKNYFTANAIIFIAGGIAFALYGPLMIDMFGILNTQGDATIYWHAASFARLYGAALFGFGFLIWSLKNIRLEDQSARRGVILSMILANGMGLVVALTQQVSIWGTLAGWITVAIYGLLLIGYIYFLVAKVS
jgi:hypothetical protein